MTAMISRAETGGSEVVLLVVGLGIGFQQINDMLGRTPAGDLVLRAVAERLKALSPNAGVVAPD